MGKVFRFHNGNDNIEDWQSSTAYGNNAIKAIEDPSGATAHREITSIPSPFARIDLVKTAFETIVREGKLDGNTIFHKIISDSLDVGEIFFNIDRFADKIEIITWDRNQHLGKLLASASRKHQLLGQTLHLYLQQDAKANNFDRLERLYLLNYKKGPGILNIIGGTSPISLFFTSANKLTSYVDLRFGNHVVFGQHYQPLYQRDIEYQKYLYGIQRFMPGFIRSFKAADDYLQMNFKYLTDEQREKIRSFTESDFNSAYEKLSVDNDNNYAGLLGFSLRKRIERPANIERDSGFTIQSKKYTGEVRPLVLPVATFNEKIRYTSALWDENNKAPYYDNRPVKERTLPFDGSQYPYLTISDFLEPTLIRTIYPINQSRFFNGNVNHREAGPIPGYILPIKKAYFDYFDTDDLLGVSSGGRKRIEISQLSAGGVKVTLRVPVQVGIDVTYERIYYPPGKDLSQIIGNEQENRGAVIENKFGLFVFPLVKLQDESANNYRIGMIDQDILSQTLANRYHLSFFKNSSREGIPEKAISSRSEKTNDTVGSDYYVIEGTAFDYIQIRHNWASGIIIPLFKTHYPPGGGQFSFAIDFGTTNTHVEFRKDGGEPMPFEIDENDMQVATLYDGSDADTIKAIFAARANILFDILKQQFTPELIGEQHEFQFPARTAIASKKIVDLNRAAFALADFNIPFVYEKYIVNSAVRTNLKWADYTSAPSEIKIIESYFENLLLLLRNKVILNGGDLSKTKLKWLFPSSMTQFRVNLLESTWNRLFSKYFPGAQPPQKVSESIAPFYYFNQYLNVSARAHTAVSIDIGGGTSDVVVYADDSPRLLTSFRYAANSVFGDSAGRSWRINGFVQHYLGEFRQLLTDKEQRELSQVLEDIQQTGRSEDIIAFFFALGSNKKLKEQNIEISFHQRLSLNSDFKIIFLLFYSALIYHVAKLIKAAGLRPPKHITFSGTGSKIINIIDGSRQLAELSSLTTLIFNKVLAGQSSVPIVSLIQGERPKEISCKGALMLPEEYDVSVRDIKQVLLGVQDDVLIPAIGKTYLDLDGQIENSVVTEYSHFIDFFFQINREINFKDRFGVSAADFSVYRTYLIENALDDLQKSIAIKKTELQDDLDVNLEESLFFYPLIGGLNNLAYKIYQQTISGT